MTPVTHPLDPPSLEQMLAAENPQKMSDTHSLYRKLEMFLDEHRLQQDKRILEYCNSKLSHPLFHLAQVARSVSSARVGVERLFSNLRYILSEQRNCLKEDTIRR